MDDAVSGRTRVVVASLVVVVFATVAAACSKSSSSSTPTTLGATTTTVSGTGTSTTAVPVTTIAPVTSAPTAACARPHAAGQFSQSFAFQGVDRTYQLYVPAAYTGSAPVPVVFDFHGYGSNAQQQMLYGNFKPLADAHDFLIVAPDGQGTVGRHFNLTNESGRQNDIAMVLALLDHIEATFCVDAQRVDATGMSDGGAMTSTLACVAYSRFAAFAPVAVVVYRNGCGGTTPISLVEFQGTADPIVPFDGGAVHCCGGSVVGSAPAAMASWAAHDHCSAASIDTRLGTEVRKRTWSNCDDASEVVFYIIDGGGHTWPGSVPLPKLGLTTKQIDASKTIWAFFQSHPLHG